MAADQNQERPAFSDVLEELGDGDVVVEVTGAAAGRVPDIAHVRMLQHSIDASYRALAGSTPVEIETRAVVEEISKQSRSVWLRAQAGGDASLLKFLARGTLAIIAWMDGSPTLQLADLQQAIRVLAWGTSITTTAHPMLPSSADLVSAIAAWQKAKNALADGNTVRIVTSNGSAELDLSKKIADPRTLLQARKLVNHSADMIFVVEMPDYQASGQWHLKHGETRTVAVAESGTLLDKFYRRELDIRPGDALRCKVDLETSYGPDHEVLSERYRIVEVLEILPAARAADVQPLQPSPEPQRRDTTSELEPAS